MASVRTAARSSPGPKYEMSTTHMSDALPRCPYDKRGKHDLCVLVPESDARPIFLFCSRCGMTARHTVDLPEPIDDLPADAIARLARK